MKIESVTLTGEFVALEPLSLEKHFAGLLEIGLDADLWKWTTNFVADADDLREYLETAVDERQKGLSLPFVILENASKKIAGCTRFGSISAENRRVEIGWTWVGREFQRSPVNTETKLLLLTHAFETWGCHRVELKTDALNARSRAAIARLGATEEALLRKHMISQNGRLRDTVYFSIVDDEWQMVKNGLQQKLQRKFDK